jgi:Cu+-exporting ATPase
LDTVFRAGLAGELEKLSASFPLYLLSGDQNRAGSAFETYRNFFSRVFFARSPHDKLEFVTGLKSKGDAVMMIGDGLNDAGALRASDVGVCVTEDSNNFSPACDVILQGEHVARLEDLMAFARGCMRVIRDNVRLSGLYNLLGLSFAVTANLTPVLCAVLMPLSSVSIMLVTLLRVRRLARRHLWA